MDQRYQAIRAVLNKGLHVICYEGKFDALPDEVRHRGPWQVPSRGDTKTFRSEYRHALARHGFIIVEQSVGVFSPAGR